MSKSRRTNPLVGKLVTKGGWLYAVHNEISPGYLDAHVTTAHELKEKTPAKRQIVAVNDLVGGTIRDIDPKMFDIISGIGVETRQ